MDAPLAKMTLDMYSKIMSNQRKQKKKRRKKREKKKLKPFTKGTMMKMETLLGNIPKHHHVLILNLTHLTVTIRIKSSGKMHLNLTMKIKTNQKRKKIRKRKSESQLKMKMRMMLVVFGVSNLKQRTEIKRFKLMKKFKLLKSWQSPIQIGMLSVQKTFLFSLHRFALVPLLPSKKETVSQEQKSIQVFLGQNK